MTDGARSASRSLRVLSACLLVLCLPTAAAPEVVAPVLGRRVTASYPHDRTSFTQGLAWDGGSLLESTGLYGESRLRRVDLRTGRVLQERHLGREFFGEGVTVVGERIVQLTWRSGYGFVYDRSSFEQVGRFAVAGEGWGLAFDGSRLVMSDGTDTLRFLDPRTFRETGRLRVRDGEVPVKRLNELEFVKGRICANVWRTERIACVSPETGRVTAWIDLTGLLSPWSAGKEDVLNGIAYDPEQDRLYVTGKRWPRIFAIEPVPAIP